MEPIKLRDFANLTQRNSRSLPAKYLDFILLTVADFPCTACNAQFLVLIENTQPHFPSDVVLVCRYCFETRHFASLQMSDQALLMDRCKSLQELGIGLASSAVGRLLRGDIFNQRNSSPGSVTDSLTSQAEETDTLVPLGYRSISWIRPHEANGIIYSHKARNSYSLKNSRGEVIFKCFYYDDASDEVAKFKSNVKAVRILISGMRVIGWIRLEEAMAILEAEKTRQDVIFSHEKFGNGGMVQYFDEKLEVTRRYGSRTRLLRKE